MKTSSCVVALGFAAGLIGTPAFAAGNLVKFEGGIGVDPVAGISAGAPVSNVVRGVSPGGRPWVIARLKADIKDDGQIQVRGEGLLLAGGDTIGTVGPITAVAATLFCGDQLLDSEAAPLDAAGNFRIRAALNGTPLNPCERPVLLIRSATVTPSGTTLGSWFAAGIPAD